MTLLAEAAEVPRSADLEVVVLAERSAEAARDAVGESLRDRGYFRLPKLGKRAHFVHPRLLRPWVMVHDEGFVRVKGKKRIGIVLPAGPGVLALGTFQSRAAADMQEAVLYRQIQPLVASWSDTLAHLGSTRREVEIAATLAEVWSDDAPAAARRATIGSLWIGTADNASGDRVRARIESFVDDVVQAEAPFLPGEVHDLNAHRTWERPFLPKGFSPF